MCILEDSVSRGDQHWSQGASEQIYFQPSAFKAHSPSDPTLILPLRTFGPISGAGIRAQSLDMLLGLAGHCNPLKPTHGMGVPRAGNGCKESVPLDIQCCLACE